MERKNDLVNFELQITGTRNRQEDSVCVTEDAGVSLSVLCDGMGGHSYGKECSSVACEVFSKAFFDNDFPMSVAQKLQVAVQEANKEVAGLYPNEISGTTLVACAIMDNEADWISVGDSHIYLFDGAELKQLNEDHTLGVELDKAAVLGRISKEIAETHYQREAITSYIGIDELTEISSGSLKLAEGHAIILCSDGIYKALSTEEMIKCYAAYAENWARNIIKAVEAKQLQSQDNASIIVLANI